MLCLTGSTVGSVCKQRDSPGNASKNHGDGSGNGWHKGSKCCKDRQQRCALKGTGQAMDARMWTSRAVSKGATASLIVWDHGEERHCNGARQWRCARNGGARRAVAPWWVQREQASLRTHHGVCVCEPALNEQRDHLLLLSATGQHLRRGSVRAFSG